MDYGDRFTIASLNPIEGVAVDPYAPFIRLGSVTCRYTGATTNITLLPGAYLIKAYGAQGGSIVGAGGLGAEVEGEFSIATETLLSVLVGGQGAAGAPNEAGGGGGGGSFVVLGIYDGLGGYTTTNPLVVAGGGGGAGVDNYGTGNNGGPGTTNQNGGIIQGFANGVAGSSGNGGAGVFEEGGGGGFFGSGSGGQYGGNGGKSFLSGGAGGAGHTAYKGDSAYGAGGFGGGGGGGQFSTVISGGGGGGYSGGGCSFKYGGGGGGSYVNGSALSAIGFSGVRTGDGLVTIVPLIVISNVAAGTVIAAKGDPVPGVSNAIFASADDPAVDGSGDIVFKATITGTNSKSGITTANNTGIWFYSGTSGALLARTGTNTIAPGTTSNSFSSLSDPLIHPSGSVLYSGTLLGASVTKSNSTALWLEASGTTTLQARAGSLAANQTNVSYGAFTQLVTETSSSPAFLSTLAGAGAKATSNLALFAADQNGTLHTIIRTGDTLLTGTNRQSVKSLDLFAGTSDDQGQSRSIDALSGNIALGLGFSDKSSAIALATPGLTNFTLISLASTTNTSVPGVPNAQWSSFGTPTVNSKGIVAFSGTLVSTSSIVKIGSSNNFGIWLNDGKTTSLIARTGNPAPGIKGALFGSLGKPVLNNNGDLAFIASLVQTAGITKANSMGIWFTTATTNGALGLIARSGNPAPGVTNATFASFGQVVLPDLGGPLFTASLAGVPKAMNSGLWSVDGSGVIHLVVQSGNTIAVQGVVKTIKSFSIFPVLPQVSGQSRSFDAQSRNITFLATFTDATWAIVQSIAP